LIFQPWKYDWNHRQENISSLGQNGEALPTVYQFDARGEDETGEVGGNEMKRMSPWFLLAYLNTGM
jgi:hypothetical protein